MQYEEPILVDLEDLEGVSGGGCNTGGSGQCSSETDIDGTIKTPTLPVP